MVSRDDWFAIHASAPPKKSLTKSNSGGSFRVDREAAPLVRAGFERAIQQMTLAKDAARELNRLGGANVNPVVDKYMTAMIGRATGDEGSVTMATDSAIAEYQSVIDQLDRAMAGYQGVDDAKADDIGRQS